MNLAIKTAFKSLGRSKVRTALTVLGIVIGIASVVIVYSAGEGLRGLILGQIESFGTDIIETEIRVPSASTNASDESQSVSAMAQGVQVTTMTLDDVDDISKLPNIIDGYGAILNQEKVSYGSESKKAFLFGVTASYIDIDKSEIKYGRYYTEAEDKSLARVVVLGSKVNEKLFGDSDPIGKYVKIKKTKFKVIGVMKERGAVMTLDFDDYVYVPVRTLQKRMMGIDHIIYMVHQVEDIDLSYDTAEQIREVLRENHDIVDPDRDDFAVYTMEEMMEMLDTITDALTLLLLAIVMISLVVGGVGIMNIMYVIVSERTKEIGLRKAIGANYKNIISQFLTEAIMITLIGGVVGIVLGVLISWLMAIGANAAGLDWHFIVPLKAFIVALGFSAVFGIVFGIYPAHKAAKMEPVEALRKE